MIIMSHLARVVFRIQRIRISRVYTHVFLQQARAIEALPAQRARMRPRLSRVLSHVIFQRRRRRENLVAERAGSKEEVLCCVRLLVLLQPRR